MYLREIQHYTDITTKQSFASLLMHQKMMIGQTDSSELVPEMEKEMQLLI